MCKLNSFSYELLCTRPHFEREALGNAEMVNSVSTNDISSKTCKASVSHRYHFYTEILPLLLFKYFAIKQLASGISNGKSINLI